MSDSSNLGDYLEDYFEDVFGNIEEGEKLDSAEEMLETEDEYGRFADNLLARGNANTSSLSEEQLLEETKSNFREQVAATYKHLMENFEIAKDQWGTYKDKDYVYETTVDAVLEQLSRQYDILRLIDKKISSNNYANPAIMSFTNNIINRWKLEVEEKIQELRNLAIV